MQLLKRTAPRNAIFVLLQPQTAKDQTNPQTPQRPAADEEVSESRVSTAHKISAASLH